MTGSGTADRVRPPPEEVLDGGYGQRILQGLRRISRMIDLHSRRLAAEFNITSPQLLCLLVIAERGPLTATSIARRVHLSPSTVVGILDRLEEKDLIHRERDVEDRRQVNLTATESGRALAVDGPPPLHDAVADALRGLPEDQQGTIVRSLEQVVEVMEGLQRERPDDDID